MSSLNTYCQREHRTRFVEWLVLMENRRFCNFFFLFRWILSMILSGKNKIKRTTNKEEKN